MASVKSTKPPNSIIPTPDDSDDVKKSEEKISKFCKDGGKILELLDMILICLRDRWKKGGIRATVYDTIFIDLVFFDDASMGFSILIEICNGVCKITARCSHHPVDKIDLQDALIWFNEIVSDQVK
jgi:hypothetical protein